MRARGLAGAAALVAAMAVVPPAAATHPTFETWRPGATTLVSASSSGGQADVNSGNGLGSACYCYDPLLGRPSISRDGRFVAFTSRATNLVPGDTNGFHDVFVKDRATGEIERVSVSSAGVQGNLTSRTPSISDDGRYVAFASAASNLVPGDTNGGDFLFSTFTDIFVRDRLTDTTERISLTTDEQETYGTTGAPHAWSDAPAISADGRYVAFTSNATNLAPGAGGGSAQGIVHVYARDRVDGVTRIASASAVGIPGSGFGMSSPSISDDGRRVAFAAVAPNLVPADTQDLDVFVKDMTTGEVELASVSSAGAQQNDANTYYGAPSLSGDGRFVAFASGATNLVPNDTNGPAFVAYGWNGGDDVFVRDLVAKTTERVSIGPSGQEYAWDFMDPQMNGDGRYVVSFGSAVHPDDPYRNSAGYYIRKVYVHDRALGTTEVVSVDDGGDLGNDHSAYPTISSDGRVVAFGSYASDLTSGDSNGIDDIFARDRGPDLGPGELTATRTGDAVEVRGWASFAGTSIVSKPDPGNDGTTIATFSAAEVGAELTGAQVVYRPERGDVLLVWKLASLPALASAGTSGVFTPAVAGRPGVTYALRFTTTGGTYEVRVLRAAASGHPTDQGSGSVTPYAGLFSCQAVCVEIDRLSAGIGTSGTEVRAALPLAEVAGLTSGSTLTGIAAFTVAGDAGASAPTRIDEVDLGASTLPVRDIDLGIAPPGTPDEAVTFDVNAIFDGATFRGTLVSPHTAPAEVVARTCLGDRCRIDRVGI